MECSIDGCDRPAKTKGWCYRHYRSWWDHGDPEATRKRREQRASRVCSVVDCGQGGKLVRGMCEAHYSRWRRTGSTDRIATEPGSVRVEQVTFNGVTFRRYPDASKRNHQRYFSPGGSDAALGVESLHREVWKHHNGAIPPGWHIHHVDGDWDNNDIGNLEALPGAEHVSHHCSGPASDAQRAHLDRVRHLASAWHRSDEGRAWHREHARRTGFGARVQPADG